MKLLTENKRVFRHSLIIAAALVAGTGTVRADHEKNDSGTKAERADKNHGDKDSKFVQEASAGGQMEVRMGQLAVQNGQSQDVKNLGQRLVDDHKKANQELQSLAQKKNISLSSDEHGKHQKMVDKLQGKSGADFDKAFVTMAVKDHKKDIAKFEKCSNDVNDPDLKAFIDKTLPTLREHLKMAQDAARNLGISEATLTSTDSEDSEAAGAPASSEHGASINGSANIDKSDKSSTDRSSDHLKSDSTIRGSTQGGAVDSDASLNIHKNSATATDIDLNRNNASGSAAVSRTDTGASTSTDVNIDAGKKHKVFSTDKSDGKLLGLIPWRKHHKAEVETDVNRNGVSVDVNRESSGSAPSSSQGTDSSDKKY
jgi:putative membrane protein